MADSDTTQQVTSQVTSQTDTTQQVTSKTPATKQKNEKRAAAGRATAEKTKAAREAQKKALIEAQSTIANYQLKYGNPPPAEAPSPPESTKNVLTTTQWLSVISIVVSLAGIYYKREEIKGLLTKKTASDSSTRSTKLACFAKKRHQTDGLNIYLYCYTMNTLQVFIKTAAVSGIAFFWVNFTVESLKLAWHIISTSPETCQPIVKVTCESCNGYFLDDGGELLDGKFLCESCN